VLSGATVTPRTHNTYVEEVRVRKKIERRKKEERKKEIYILLRERQKTISVSFRQF
jgi:hypothetical protein